MSKAIISKIELPGVSEELINKLRYRVINRNRNLYSQWSVIGEIKRSRDQINFDENQTSFATDNSRANIINVTWYTSDINQEFDVYVRYKLKRFDNSKGGFIYRYEPLQYLGRKSTNNISITPLPLSGRVGISSPSNYSVQTMVKLPEYPRIFSLPVEILNFERFSNEYVYYTNREPTFSVDDYVNINLENSFSDDNSEFAGIKRVSGIGAKSFSVDSVGADIAMRSANNVAGSINNAEKVNGTVQFVTDDIIFT